MQWQPIDTAPLHELVIICDKTRKVQQGYIYEISAAGLTSGTTIGDRMGFFSRADSWGETRCKPIAWMPLPPPLAEQS